MNDVAPMNSNRRTHMRSVATVRVAGLLCALLPLFVHAQEGARSGSQGINREISYPQIASGKWTGPRLRDGQPDVQGHWSNTIANHNNLTDPQGGVPGDPTGRVAKGSRETRAPSRVTDPADGQVPFQPWARAKQQEFLQYFHNPIKPEYIEPLARCAPAGVPKSFTWHGFEIRQYPNIVLLMFNSGTRIIYLDGRPHLPEDLKLWNADSRGRWEGNTLIVDVRNNNGKARLARTGEFVSENVHIEERYVFDNSGKRFNYIARITDPTVFTQPWTITIPMRRYTEADEPDGWHFEVAFANHPTAKKPIVERPERICVENNGPFGQVAVGAP
jgi:hypothetical protein